MPTDGQASAPYGDQPIGDYGRWWSNCANCGASVTVRAEESPTLPDPEDWEDGMMGCPVCDGELTGWNGDPR